MKNIKITKIDYDKSCEYKVFNNWHTFENDSEIYRIKFKCWQIRFILVGFYLITNRNKSCHLKDNVANMWCSNKKANGWCKLAQCNKRIGLSNYN